MRADTHDASIVALPEWQCRPHPTGYQQFGPDAMRITREVDLTTRQEVAIHMTCQRCAYERVIYMDGRPHPPEDAAHTWEGFSTGTWEGDGLKIRVSHLKESYVRRNGLQFGPRATVTEFLFLHGDYLTWTMMVDDPAYLTEPVVRNASFIRNPGQQVPSNPCVPIVEEDRPEGQIPHYLPGMNPYLTEYAARRELPLEASRGGAETMYPEYQLRLREMSDALPASDFLRPEYRDDTNPAEAQQDQGQDLDDSEIQVLRVRGNVYMLAGAGGNITLSIGPDGILLVDAGRAQMSDRVLDTIRQLARDFEPSGAPMPVRIIINTHVHGDHTGGNEQIADDVIFAPVEDAEQIVAHHNVLNRMALPPNDQTPAPYRAQPTHTFIRDKYRVNRFFNGEGIEVIHIPSAHTDGDSIVWFRFSDVISTGDIFLDSYPLIDLERGGSIQGIIDGVLRIIDIVYPQSWSQGGTMLIPGHGRLSDLTDIAYYRDMLTIVRDRIQDMMDRGLTLEQVKAARPTLDYDPIYGTNPGSGDRFIEQAYRSLSQN